MKTIYKYLALVMAIVFCVACNPLEDNSLREKYYENVGTPITKEDLEAAISVSQPFPNEDEKVEGDQYVVIKNSRPDIGGTWHLGWSTGEKTLGTDNDTVIYESNGEFDIYYMGISENKIIKTDPIRIKVTNVFDEYEALLTGAKDKADKTAKKTWEYRELSFGAVCYMGAHGAWKYIPPEATGIAWWAQVSLAKAGEQTMVFEYNGNVIKTFKPDGSLIAEGKYAINHNAPENKVLGELITVVPVIGGQYDEVGQKSGSNNVFWIVTFDEDYLSIYHPNKYSGGADWDDYGWWAFYKAKK